MKIFKNIVIFFLSLQEGFLTRRLNKTLGVKNHSKRKKYFTNGCFLSIESLAESEKQKLEGEISLILKNSDYNPEKILEYIQKQGTNLYYIDKSSALSSISENEGFIYPQTGAKALYISLLTTKKFSLKTNEMFILTKGVINTYYFIYHFYNWYAFKHNIEGLDTESQNLLKKYLFSDSEEDFKKLQLADIYKLKDAIKQDKAAIEFVFKLCRESESSKKAVEKIKDKGANI